MMNHKALWVVMLTVVVFCSAACSRADSIWARRGRDMRVLYADNVARNIGDVLTIKITENSRIDNKAKRDLKKETDKSIVFDGEVGNFVDLGDFGMDAESTNELKSKADFKDERKFVDSITVVVVDVLPNGSLVVMGTRNRNIAGDIHILEVSGIVRCIDIAPDNTIASERVADFRIVSRNEGTSAPYTRPGWLGRIFDVIWPF